MENNKIIYLQNKYEIKNNNHYIFYTPGSKGMLNKCMHKTLKLERSFYICSLLTFIPLVIEMIRSAAQVFASRTNNNDMILISTA
uniref:Uncharacterized protein n=1 Tax=Heterorhabditis bacteriophora TaxID=37862 RepID=A0A1I7WYP3_HETBA